MKTTLLEKDIRIEGASHPSFRSTAAFPTVDIVNALCGYLSPSVFLIGIICGFLACCLVGHFLADAPLYKNFTRFHPLISPESFFYPTINQLRAQACAARTKDQILVIVGGNSILNGVGQTESELWSKKLQQRLGEKFAVINLAFRGSLPFEAAFIAAESLSKDGLPVVFVTNTTPSTCGSPEAGLYGWFYWEAFHRSMLYRSESREISVKSRLSTKGKTAEQLAELRLRTLLDSQCNFQDLWTGVSYKHISTVYNFLADKRFWKARQKYDDPGNYVPPPIAQENDPYLKKNFEIIRGFSSGCLKQSNKGNWVETPEVWSKLQEEIGAAVPPEFKSHVLVVFAPTNPWYMQRLSSAEKERDTALHTVGTREWKRAGISAIAPADGFEESDFYDRVHLTGSGGEKLAAAVAPQVARIAQRLGYLK